MQGSTTCGNAWRAEFYKTNHLTRFYVEKHRTNPLNTLLKSTLTFLVHSNIQHHKTSTLVICLVVVVYIL